MKKLIIVNLLFAMALGAFLVLNVQSNWAWLALIGLWCFAEGWLAQLADLEWYHFATLFAVLAIFEVAIVGYFLGWF